VLDFVLRQFDAETVKLGFGGGEITEPTAGEFQYDPPDPSVIDERMMGLEWPTTTRTTGSSSAAVLVTSNTETQVVRGKASDIPISFGIIGEDGVTPWLLQTDDPSFAALVGS